MEGFLAAGESIVTGTWGERCPFLLPKGTIVAVAEMIARGGSIVAAGIHNPCYDI